MIYLEKNEPRVCDFFGFDWSFCLENGNSGGELRPVQLPHDWSVEYPFDENSPTCGSGGYVKAGIGRYKKYFRVSPSAEGKTITLMFDGAYMCTEVWLNGSKLGKHIYGYTPFEYDVSDVLDYHNENIIEVRVDNSKQPNSRWYTGSGITRDVWIKAVNPAHIATYGTYIRTVDITDNKAAILIDTTVVVPENSDINITTKIYDNNGIQVAESKLPVSKSDIVQQQLCIGNPCLWSDKTPYLYKAKSILTNNGEVTDIYETKFGIRNIAFEPDRGFLINGEQVKLNGFCVHHDGGSVGAAVPKAVWKRRLNMFKQMGANAVRASHNPPDPALLDLCDEMGFYVMDEAFDEWEILKGKEFGSNTHESRGYSEWFKENHVADIESMLYRDRNHPSVILWSIGNEVPEQTHPDGHLIAKELMDICHRLDPTRLTTQANDQICAEPRAATKEFLDTLDVVGYNYTGRWRTRAETLYDDDKRANPGWRIIGTENASASGVRGDYSFERKDNSFWRRLYFSAPVSVGRLLRYTMTHDYVAGDFMWTGIDYLGEAHWPNRSACSGVLDTCGFPKDHYYFYKSIWNRDEPMVYAFPHWNIDLPEGKIFPVLCYTNCEYAELFVNGKSYGKKAYGYPLYGMTETYGHFDTPPIHANTDDLFLSWDAPFEQGCMEVVGYSKGKEACRYKVKTAGEAAAIKASADTYKLNADGRDITHIEVSLTDKDGVFNPTASNRLHVAIDGPAELIGIDNGRPDCHESFKGNTMTAHGGLLLIMLRSMREAGKISVKITAEGLSECVLELESI